VKLDHVDRIARSALSGTTLNRTEKNLSPDISYPLGGKPSSPFEAKEFERGQKAIQGIRFGLMRRLAEVARRGGLLPVK
jgi:hypothetical protein